MLIGESGGSKTDWAFLSAGNETVRFTSSSLHPKNWRTFDFDALFEKWNCLGIKSEEVRFFFFGAGCNHKSKQDELSRCIEPFGFFHMKVFGDLLAASKATLGNKDGSVAILGSGSVFMLYKKGEVKEYFGGFGRDLGDEGGGFYFGKLLAQKLREKTLSEACKHVLRKMFTEAELEILSKETIDSEFLLTMPSRLSAHKDIFAEIHIENIRLFFEKYIKVPKGEKIHFVGSYAFFHQDFVKKIGASLDYKIGNFVERPIEKLVSFYQNYEN